MPNRKCGPVASLLNAIAGANNWRQALQAAFDAMAANGLEITRDIALGRISAEADEAKIH